MITTGSSWGSLFVLSRNNNLYSVAFLKKQLYRIFILHPLYRLIMKYKSQFQKAMLVCSLFSVIQLHSQTADSKPDVSQNKKGFLAGAAAIYNYSKPSYRYFDIEPLGFFPNGSPHDSLYRFKSRNMSTVSFGIFAGYNKPFSKKFSFSCGLEMDQRKEQVKYLLYEDGKLGTPEPVSYTVTKYAFFVPLRINYYIGRFIISAGNNIGFEAENSIKTNYNDGSKTKTSRSTIDLDLHFRESLSFQLWKAKGLYLQVSAEQGENPVAKYGYNHFFMGGGSYYF